MLRELQSAADAAEEAERDVVAAISEAQQLLAELDAQPETRWPLRGGCGGLLLVCELTLVLSATRLLQPPRTLLPKPMAPKLGDTTVTERAGLSAPDQVYRTRPVPVRAVGSSGR